MVTAAPLRINGSKVDRVIEMSLDVSKMIELQEKATSERERVFIRTNMAKAIGLAKNAELYPFLHDFVNDESTDVIKAAITSIGKAADIEFLPVLIAHLNTKHLRKHVRGPICLWRRHQCNISQTP